MQTGAYRNLIEEKRKWYKGIDRVFCPCLKINVTFNFKGFYHLLYKGTGERRSKVVTIERMNLLPLSILIIKNATEFKEYRNEYSKKLDKSIHSWELSGVIQGLRISVILRKIGNGNVMFYSIWKNKK